MLRKLLKHEFRATGRVMGPLYLILLLTAVGGNISMRIMDHQEDRFLNLLGGLLMVAFVVAVIGVCVMSLVLMVQRFYKNLMGDEGYVMFTLPVSIHQHVWAKLIVSSVWFIATGAAVALAGLIMVSDVRFISELMEAARWFFSQVTGYYALNGVAIFVELLVLVFLGCAAMCLEFYAAIAVGNSFANHKGLLSVAFFFGFQFVTQFLSSAALLVVDDSWISRFLTQFNWDVAPMQAIHLMMGVGIVIAVVYGAIFYGITTVTLKKRLNLE